MTNPVMQVRETRAGAMCFVWCPGCDLHHVLWVRGEDGSVPAVCWGWDRELEIPTFEGSLLVTGGSKNVRCHSHLRAGRWEFLSDSTHELAGQTVSMVPLPDWLVREGQE